MIPIYFFLIVNSTETNFYSKIDETFNSAIVFSLKLKRDSYFYITYYVIPSLIFVIISYCSFWIDKNATTARCSIAITTTVITIQFYIGINTVLPPINYPVWLSTYFTGILIYTCLTMLEYAAVNFSTLNYV
jgi:gamma-aminobutyric acid receptor subunit alpha